jgi:hypothetical protein
MRLLLKLAVLGLAGYGAERLYRRFEPRLAEVADRREEITSAATRVGDEAREAVREVAGEAVAATRDVVRSGPPASGRLPTAAPGQVLP